jgi:ribonuclease HI
MELLHADFVEIGRSGRRWSRDEIVAALSAERERVAPETDEWRLSELGPDLALVTYLIRGVDGDVGTRRSGRRTAGVCR